MYFAGIIFMVLASWFALTRTQYPDTYNRHKNPIPNQHHADHHNVPYVTTSLFAVKKDEPVNVGGHDTRSCMKNGVYDARFCPPETNHYINPLPFRSEEMGPMPRLSERYMSSEQNSHHGSNDATSGAALLMNFFETPIVGENFMIPPEDIMSRSIHNDHYQVLAKMHPGPRHQHVPGPDGPVLQDLWLETNDLYKVDSYNADRDNIYYIYTRDDVSTGQPIKMGDINKLKSSRYDSNRRTVVLIHGWQNKITSRFFNLLVPAFLDAEDVNIIAVDWSIGAEGEYVQAVLNTLKSGEGVARFIKWLNKNTGSDISQYRLVGHSLGGQQVGIVGRELDGKVPFINALDPAMPGWMTSTHKFTHNDGDYTEVMHTNAGLAGYVTAIGDVDFYPNGGSVQPGCDSTTCNHNRCLYYMAESLRSGGFTGRGCSDVKSALQGDCDLPESLKMGGLQPHFGKTGIYYLKTNAQSPFSKG